MITRKMAEAIQRQIEELTAQLEAQRLQIATLEEIRASIGSSRSSPIPSNSAGTLIKPDASRIPDAIKMIVPYRGDSKDKKTLATWISSVEGKLEHAKKLYSAEADVQAIMPLWVGIIRDKIVEEASDALASRNNPTEWVEIKQVLIEYFGDKRDLCTLVTQISYLKQGTKSITEFYNQCRELLSDIVAKLLLNEETKPCIEVLTRSYEDMILNSFVDGLEEPYSTLTRTSRPSTLLMAFQGAIDQFNATQRRKEKFPKPPMISQKPFPQAGFKPSFLYNKPTQFHQNFSYQRQTPQNYQYQRQMPQNSQYNRGQFNPNSQFQRQPIPPQTVPYIKPDPSGQAKRIVPYQRTTQLNSHETAPLEGVEESQAYENEHEPPQNEMSSEIQTIEDNINFHFVPTDQQEE